MSAFDIVSGVIGGCVGVILVWAVVRELLNTKPTNKNNQTTTQKDTK